MAWLVFIGGLAVLLVGAEFFVRGSSRLAAAFGVPALVIGGVTVSSVKPIGKAEFNNKQLEVRSEGNYIEENQPVRVIKIDNKRIFVEPINT